MRTAPRTSDLPVVVVPTLALSLTLVLAACGAPDSADSSESDDSGDGAFPVTVTDARGEVTLDEQPERIVSLSPTSTEMLFEVGAGDQVVAADEHSTYPEEAPDTELSGFTPSAEAVAEHDPDLVVLDSNAEDAADQLEAIDVPALMLGAGEDLQDTYDQMRLLGEATGNAGEADEAAQQVEAEVTETVEQTQAELGEDAEDLTVYHELDDAMHSAGSATFIGQVYEEFGLRNIADDAEEGGAYPKLSPEFVVDADPDLIFLGYETDGAVEALADRSAFDTVTAVSEDNVTTLDPDVSSRWGPRVAELTEEVGDAVVAATES